MAEEFDVCISYARKDADYVLPVVAELRRKGWSVYLDVNRATEVAGLNLPEELIDAYQNAKRCCVLFVSNAYAESDYTKLELRAAMQRAFRDDRYLIPVRMDDTEMPGVLPGVIWIEGRQRSPKRVAEDLHARLLGTKPALPRRVREAVRYVGYHPWHFAVVFALLIGLGMYWIWLQRPSRTTVQFLGTSDTLDVRVHNSGGHTSKLTGARLTFHGMPLRNTALRMVAEKPVIERGVNTRMFVPAELELEPTVTYKRKKEFVEQLSGSAMLEYDLIESDEETARQRPAIPISANNIRPFVNKWVAHVR